MHVLLYRPLSCATLHYKYRYTSTTSSRSPRPSRDISGFLDRRTYGGRGYLFSRLRFRKTGGYLDIYGHFSRSSSSRSARDRALGGAEQSGRRVNISDEDFVSGYPALKAVGGQVDEELKAYGLELHATENRKAHHTDYYEQSDLIIRRGQHFSMTITFNRPYVKDQDKVILQLLFGNRPLESKGTNVRIVLSHDEPANNDDWHVTLHSADDDKLLLDVLPAADASVGRYHINVETVTHMDGNTFTHRRIFEEQFIVLFNVWCKEDSVYMSEDSEREEYVLNDRGRIWIGTFSNYEGLAWNFGQFEDTVLEAALYVLNKGELADGARSDPLKIARCISAMANACDDNGVLEGRWTDSFPKNCTEPWAWTGSVAILEEYMKTKHPVKYGQCWVFSGLVTTLCRALGLPTRSVTNFESAHDMDASITIDYHWNEDDEPLTDYNDSVWNFHVWNESYFQRPDLPEGYGGWQAHDATPQEVSEGVMRCGPAPVRAIREGNVYIPYDAAFIFAEVNGDKVHWQMKKDGSMEVLSKEKNAVGHCISTKAVGSNERHDVTLEYKFKEGSEEERKAVHRAVRYSSRRKHQIYDIPEPDVTFTLDAPDNATIGDDFMLKVILKNKTEEVRNTSVRLTAIASYYTGVPSERVGVKVFNEKLAPDEEKTCELLITSQAYESYIKPDSVVTVYMKGRVIETSRAYARTRSLKMKKPALILQVPERTQLGEAFSLVIKFTNPLNVSLTGGSLHIEASGITKPRLIYIRKSIGPRAEFTHTIDDLVPVRSGERTINVSFCANQLTGLTGTVDVYVSYSY